MSHGELILALSDIGVSRSRLVYLPPSYRALIHPIRSQTDELVLKTRNFSAACALAGADEEAAGSSYTQIPCLRRIFFMALEDRRQIQALTAATTH